MARTVPLELSARPAYGTAVDPLGIAGDGPVGSVTDAAPDVFLTHRGISRRTFMEYCGFLAAVLALPKFPFGSGPSATDVIANALSKPLRLPVVWLNGQDCNGNIESFLRASNPSISQIILDKLSINYAELLMAPAGAAAEQNRIDTVNAGGYLAVMEGAVPTGAGGAYACIGGRAHQDIVKEVGTKALATIAVGTCAFSGGLAAARGGVTGAKGVKDIIGAGATVIALPGCPMNVDNLVATIVHYLTFGTWPATDGSGRPLFAYGSEIHEHCPRRSHFEREEFVRAWGDKGHQQGWCLRYMGCQGPETRSNCPTVKWNQGTSWPIGAGAPCFSCVSADFWDVSGGFYKHRKDD